MILADLLRGRNLEIIKVKANDCIADAATMLTENKIGALIVQDDSGEIVGILSERDIVGGMGPHGADLHDVLVSELMTVDLVKCAPTDTVLEAMAMMTDRRIRHLPVFDGDDLIGFISIGDMVKCRISEVQAEAEAMRQYIAS
jgi:CBS domain-containing protein